MQPRRPWITERTLDLIEKRNTARQIGDHYAERALNKAIKQSAKMDRKVWLNISLDGGNWSAIRSLTRQRKHKQGRLRDLNGQFVDSSMRAETLAEYLEKVQWAVHFADAVPQRTPAFETLRDIKLSSFTASELKEVVSKLKRDRAPGSDGVPAEFWQALATNDAAANMLLRLCNACWANKAIPPSWACATVVSLFKKGDTSLPSNYRPISLLTIGYKVLAALMLQRLQAGGADERIQRSQYGFRKGRSTGDALFVARRMIDAAIDDRDGVL